MENKQNLTHLLDTTELQYKNQITSLKEEIDDLNEGIDAISEERGILEDRYEELQKENEYLKTSIQTTTSYWSDKYDILKEKNEKLKNTIKKCQELLRAIN